MWRGFTEGSSAFLCGAHTGAAVEELTVVSESRPGGPVAEVRLLGRSPVASKPEGGWGGLEAAGKLSPASASTESPSEGEVTEGRGWEELAEELFRLYRSLDVGKLRDLGLALASRLRCRRADDVCAGLLAAEEPMCQAEFREYLVGLFTEASLDLAEQTAVMEQVVSEAAQQPTDKLSDSCHGPLKPAEKALHATMAWLLERRSSPPVPPTSGRQSQGNCGLPPVAEELRRWASRPKSQDGYEFGDLFVKAAVRRVLSSAEPAEEEAESGEADWEVAAARQGSREARETGGVASLLPWTACGQGPFPDGCSQEADSGEFSSEVELEGLLRELFRLQDLNSDGTLEELELIQLNKKIAVLHFGHGVDKAALAEKYRGLFRSRLDASGAPVPYATFRRYMRQVLTEMEPHDEPAQHMILEQFVAEAAVARRLFRAPSLASESDAPFLAALPPPEELQELEAAQAEGSGLQGPPSTPPTAAAGGGTGKTAEGPGQPWPRRPLWHELW